MKKILVTLCVISMFGATAAMAKEASDIFKTTCSPCHGANGEGKKPMGNSLKDSAFVKTGSEADIIYVIKNGRSGADKKFKEFPSPMPAQKALSDDELGALAKFLKTKIAK